MSDIPSSFTKVNDVEVASDAPLTEALNFKYGGNDNYLFDELVLQDARLDALETVKAEGTGLLGSANWDGVSSNQTVATVTINSIVGTKLYVSFDLFWTFTQISVGPAPVNPTATFQFRRNGTSIYQFSDTTLTLSEKNQGLSLLDVGLTSGGNYTYDIFLLSVSPTNTRVSRRSPTNVSVLNFK